MSQPVVSIADATVHLRKQVVLQHLDLEVQPGESVGLLGPNGSGKSTLLRLVVGLIRPRSGEVVVFGQAPSHRDVLRRVGAAIDAPALYPWMSGKWVLRTLIQLSGEPDRGRAESALQRFGLTACGRKPVISYSQGMRKRLALAVASVRTPELLVLDEPTNALDADGLQLTRAWLADHRARGGTMIVATHRAEDLQMCDRVLALEDGALTQLSGAGHVEELANRGGT